MGYGAGIQPGYGAGRGVGFGAGAQGRFGAGPASGFGAGYEASSWSPLSLGSSLAAWWDNSDLSTLWQDSARTTPVTADGDPRGAIDDKSGNGRHRLQATDTKRSLYKAAIQNGRAVGRYDGTDDFDSVANFPLGTKYAIVTAQAYRTSHIFIEHSASVLANDGFYLYGDTGNASFVIRSGLAVNMNPSSVPFAGTNPSVLVARFDGADYVLRRDGVDVSGSYVDHMGPDQTTVTDTLYCMARAGTSVFAGVDEYETFIINGDVSLASLVSAERYLRAKWGTP